MDRMIEYNNAGARYVDEGRFEEALVMFRAALERKLAWDSATRANGQGQPVERCVTPDIVISSAESSSFSSHAERLGGEEAAATLQHEQRSRPSPVPFEANPPSSLTTTTTTTHLAVDPLYRRAFRIGNDQDMIAASAIIIFNMALAHQILDATSSKAGPSYQIAAFITTMEGFQPTKLHQAILQNLNVWVSDTSTNTTPDTTATNAVTNTT